MMPHGLLLNRIRERIVRIANRIWRSVSGTPIGLGLWRKVMSFPYAHFTLGLVAVFASLAGGVAADGLAFSTIVIDASAVFECAGIGDIDGDGKNDIVSGSYWYSYPGLERHFICEIAAKSGYRDDFSNSLMDVDGDGDLDIVSVTWFTEQCLWRENPGSPSGTWREHMIDKPGNCETGYLDDLSGDRVPDLVVNVAQAINWYEHINQPPYWKKRSPGKEGVQHGLGTGDINGDGRKDIVTPKGWYEAPEDTSKDPWAWHPEFDLGSTSVPILVFDVNGDGLSDIVFGMGHDYGVFWMKQNPAPDSAKQKWIRLEIDKSWSQAHAMFHVDLDQSGRPGFITGKRYHAHNGQDPGAEDPIGVYFYQYDRQQSTWIKTNLDYGNRVGFGLMPAVGDIDGDGDTDVVCSGKSGLYLLLNKLK